MAFERDTPGRPTSCLLFLPRTSNFFLLIFTSKGLFFISADVLVFRTLSAMLLFFGGFPIYNTVMDCWVNVTNVTNLDPGNVAYQWIRHYLFKQYVKMRSEVALILSLWLLFCSHSCEQKVSFQRILRKHWHINANQLRSKLKRGLKRRLYIVTTDMLTCYEPSKFCKQTKILKK